MSSSLVHGIFKSILLYSQVFEDVFILLLMDSRYLLIVIEYALYVFNTEGVFYSLDWNLFWWLHLHLEEECWLSCLACSEMW